MQIGFKTFQKEVTINPNISILQIISFNSSKLNGKQLQSTYFNLISSNLIIFHKNK